MATVRQRFQAKVGDPTVTGCTAWRGHTNRTGYGSFRILGHVHRAHRVAWAFANGPIPNGMHVLHSCDTPACVNPAHLFLGTHEDNMADMKSKARSQRRAGEQHHAARLTLADVDAIRQRYHGLCEEPFAIARDYPKVGPKTVWSVCVGRSWSQPPLSPWA